MASNTPLTQLEPGGPMNAPDLLSTTRTTQQLAGNILSRSGWFIGFLILDIVIVIGILGDPILKEAWNFIIPYSYSQEAHYNGLAVGTLIVLVNLVVSIIAGLYFANRATPAVGLRFALKMIVIGTLVGIVAGLISAANISLQAGIGVTIGVTIIAFIFALVIGLITAFGRLSKNAIIYNLSTFYIELFRGLPLLVIILIFAFVITPAFVTFVAGSGDENSSSAPREPRIPFADDLIQRMIGIPEERISTTVLRTRDIDPVWRIMFAFALTYGAFMSEVFRAGIESIGKGQMEAARSLGMTYFQGMRHIVLPQAIRNVLPALVNNFVFLLKDTSLASVVAVPEISHLTRQYSSNRFRYPEGLLVLSFLYANLTIFLSMAAIFLERRLHRDRHRT